MSSVSAHLAAALEGLGIHHVFGVMGNGNAHFIAAVVTRQPHLTYSAMRHEAGTVVAADAHQRVGGGLAVATCTYGAGFANLVGPLAEAALAAVPLLLVTGAEPTTGARSFDVDQTAIAAAAGVPTLTLGASGVAATVREAVESALATRRPVVLAIPNDLATAEAGALPGPDAHEPPRVREPVVPEAGAIDRLAHRVAKATRPLLWPAAVPTWPAPPRAWDDLPTPPAR